MKTIKLGIILNGKEIINKLADLKLSADKVWDVVDLIDDCNANITKFQKLQQEKVQEVGEDDGEGRLKIKEDKINEWNEYLNGLINKDVEIKEVILNKSDLIGFSANELLLIRELVTLDD